MLSSSNRRTALAASAALVAGITALSTVTSTAASAPRSSHHPTESRSGAHAASRGHFDLRTAGGAQGQAQRLKTEARASRNPETARIASGIDGALLDIDGQTGTPRLLGKLDGFLTGPSDRTPRAVTLRYVENHLAALGLRRQDLKSFIFRDDYTDITGVHHLSWKQKYAGMQGPFVGYGLQSAVDKQGRLLMLGGSPVPSALLGRAASARAITSRDAAIRAARRASGESPRAGADDSAERVTFFTRGRTYDAWQTITMSADQPALTVQDAATGRLLYRRPLGQDERTELARPAHAKGVAFEGYTKDPYASYDFTKLGWLKAGATILSGNNAHAYSDVNDDNQAQATEEVHPKTGHTWSYKVQGFDVPGMESYCDGPYKCVWNPDVPFSWRKNRAQNTTQVFWFVNKWHDVIKKAPYGFTEDAGNFQERNPSGQGKAGDGVKTNTLDGANTDNGLPDGQHVDNANMSTPPDGKRPTMQMYLQHTPGTVYSDDGDPFPANNTGDEADTIYHEYTHGISNRLVISPTGESSLGGVQAGAMGEAWSDFYALSYLIQKGIRPDQAGTADVWLAIADGLGKDDVRTEPIDCQVGDSTPDCTGALTGHTGGYTYADYGQIIGGPEVHADGEIWSQTLWDLREQLGYATSTMLVARAMELSPYDPSMLDERNAILMADTAVFGGAHHADIWEVFAHRGMGFYAGALGGQDSQPGASFDTPPTNDQTGTVSGTVTDSATGDPVAGVPVTLAFQGADQLVNPSAVTDANGHYELGPVPAGDYPKLLVSAGGYIPETAEVHVTPGGANKDIQVTRDWAAASGGASIADFNGPDYSPDCGPGGAIDLSQATGWGSTTGDDAGTPTNVFVPKYIVVELPQAVDVDSFGVDPSMTCGDGGSASTGDYQIETAPSSTGPWTTAAAGTFTADDRGRINMVNPTAGSAGVQFVKFTILSNQTPDFATNCPDGPYSGCQYTDLTELEVLGSPSAG